MRTETNRTEIAMPWGPIIAQPERELMLRLAGDGHTHADIARKLARPVSTVERHVRRERQRRRETAPCSICGAQGTRDLPTQYVNGVSYCVRDGAVAELVKNGRGV
jgi:hypothetical protein